MSEPTEAQLQRLATEIGARLHAICSEMPDEIFDQMCFDMARVQWHSEKRRQKEADLRKRD